MGISRLAQLRAHYQAALSTVGIPPAGVRPIPPRPPLTAAVVAAWLASIPWPIVGGVERDNDWAFLLAPLPIASLLFLASLPTLFPQLLPMWPLRAALALAILVMALTGWDGGQVLGGLFLAIVCGVIPAVTATWAVLLLRRHGAADGQDPQSPPDVDRRP